MWYFRKVVSSCEQFGTVPTFFWTKYVKKKKNSFWEKVQKIKMDVNRLLLVSKFKKSFRYILLKLGFFQFLNQK